MQADQFRSHHAQRLKTRILFPLALGRAASEWQQQPLPSVVEDLRGLVLAPPANEERFHVVFLDEERRRLGSAALGEGRLGAVSLNLRDLFGRALAVGARRMIMAHNHPSGDCRPSEYDIDATQRISTVAHSLGIELVDHLIFSGDSVFSMRKGGEL